MSAGAELLLALPERYELGRHLADGGMGSVWCARDLTLDRTVAIKVLAAPFASDQTAMRRFAREARAAAQLSTHPHVVTIYDVGEAEGRPFIVMEYVSGGTVGDALRLGTVGLGEAVRWIRQAAEALDFAHRHGIVHRDIKPQNLLLDRARSLRIADFGIAHLASEELLTRTREVLGTAAYIAPEQALGNPGSAASDRYSLAVAAFELLTGRRPFIGEHPAAQARAHLEDEPPAATSVDPSLPAAVDPVLRRGMAKRADERWPTATAFAEALAGAVEGRDEAATAVQAVPAATVPMAARTHRAAVPPPAAPPPRRRSPAPMPAAPPGRGSRTAPAIAALAAAMVVLLAILLSGGGSSRTAGGAAPPARHVAARPRATRAAPAPSSRRTGSAPAPPAATPAGVAGSSNPDVLESQGHALLLAGNPAGAIPVLRQAVAQIPHSDLNYAYALFDLGRALRLDGQPAAAIPILEQRAAIPNQTATVLAELRLAQQAAGQASSPSPAGGPAPAPPPGHDRGHGRDHGSGRGQGPDGQGPPGQGGD